MTIHPKEPKLPPQDNYKKCHEEKRNKTKQKEKKKEVGHIRFVLF
jgi:hypothetical protein